MLTKNGICYDLENSPFVCTTPFFEYRFSSGTHLRKFNGNVDLRKSWLNDSMSRRFHIDVDMEILAELQLYMQVETRGFYVSDGEKVWRNAENIRLSGLRVSGEDSLEPSVRTTTR